MEKETTTNEEIYSQVTDKLQELIALDQDMREQQRVGYIPLD